MTAQPRPSLDAKLSTLAAALNAHADNPDVLALLTGFETRVSQIIADMQAVAKSSRVMAGHLSDAIEQMDDVLADTLGREIRLLEAAQDAKDDAEEAREIAGLRSDYFRRAV